MIIPPHKPSTARLSDSNSHDEGKLSRKDILRRISIKRWDLSTGNPKELPPLNCRNDLVAWVSRVEEDLMAADVMIPRFQWADAGILYLAEPLNLMMRQQQARRIAAGGLDTWLWEDFQASLSQIIEDRESRSGIQSFREDHPLAATALTVTGAGLVVAGSIALAPAILVGGLNVVGFTVAGVARGSIAAAVQSGFYGGATTGIFSACQSIGATWAAGSASTIIPGVASVVAGAKVLSASRKTKRTNSASDLREDSRSTSLPSYR